MKLRPAFIACVDCPPEVGVIVPVYWRGRIPTRCKVHRERTKQRVYRKKSRAKFAAYYRDYYLRNREKKLAKSRQRYWAKRVEGVEYARKYRAEFKTT